MIDTELLSELRLVARNLSIEELSPQAADDVIQAVSNSLLEAKRGTWWWEDIRADQLSVDYLSDGLSLLRRLLIGVGPICLVATDDEAPPWPVFSGSANAIIELVQAQRFFEYFITGVPYDWAVFDTHHNSLVAAGTIAPQAKVLLTQ